MHSKCSTKLMKVKFQEKKEIQIQVKLTCAYSIIIAKKKLLKIANYCFPLLEIAFFPSQDLHCGAKLIFANIFIYFIFLNYYFQEIIIKK